MIRLIQGLGGNYSKLAIEHFLAIAAAPNRRRSVGVVCDPLTARPPKDEERFFGLPTQLIARSLLVRSANPVAILGQFEFPPLVVTTWNELKKIPGVRPADPMEGTGRKKKRKKREREREREGKKEGEEDEGKMERRRRNRKKRKEKERGERKAEERNRERKTLRHRKTRKKKK
jgi:hypothetical protein